MEARLVLCRSVFIWAAALAAGCGGGGATTGAPPATPRVERVRVLRDRPVLAVVDRQGDPRGAIGVAVTTSGLAPERGAVPSVALAGLVEARLAAAGVRDVAVVPGWDGYRVRALVATPREAEELTRVLRMAMLAPATDDAAALAAARKKVAALARRPMIDMALVDAARCAGEPFALPGAVAADEPSKAELEGWRRDAHGLGRVAFATAGSGALGDAVAVALASLPPWPSAPAPRPEPVPAPDARAEVYTAGEDLPAGGARVTLAAHAWSAIRAVEAAAGLGDPRGALASRLGALDAPAALRKVTATAHVGGGCVTVSFDLAARDLGSDPAGRIATATALARQEVGVEIAEAPLDPAAERGLALAAADPRDAAERAAWWTLLDAEGSPAGLREPRISVAIGLASGRDAPGPAASPAPLGPRAQAIRSELDRATVAWQSPVVEGRTRVEKGQGELWVLVASPCGVGPEVEADAGLGAAAAYAAAEAGRERGLELDPWVSGDGIGIVAHAPALAGESPAAHARRVADAAARSFVAEPLEPAAVARARAELLARAATDDARSLATLAGALAPGHPSWIAWFGTLDGLGRASDDAVSMRASALRAGPLRAAVLANDDAAQAEIAVRAVDRWVARRPGEVRACAPLAATRAPTPGTYAVEAAAGTTTEALLAVPLPANDEPARLSAQVVAAALDGEDGLLARALGMAPDSRTPDAGPPLARSSGARVVGPPGTPALVVRIAAPDATLDAAVAQTRALLDRLREGGMTEADRTRGAAAQARAELDLSLDPRARLVALWRGKGEPAPPPTLEQLRAFCAASLVDGSLVIVAARPR